MQNMRHVLLLSGISVALCIPFLRKRSTLPVFVSLRLKISQTSALHLPVMPEGRCDARTGKATTSATVSQAGPEPDVRKVMSSLRKAREVMGLVGHGVLELRRGHLCYDRSYITSRVCGQMSCSV